MTTTYARLPAASAVLEEAVAFRKVLGAYLFVRKGDDIVADAAFGESEPGTVAMPDDVGELRCAVKPLTTLCVAKAMEAGLLSFDDTLTRWAPADTSRRIAEISLRQLLTHTSGLPRYGGPGVYDVDFDEYVTGIFKTEIAPPLWDSQPLYNHAKAWHLLAWVLQKVYGLPIHELISEIVTKPLDLPTMGLVDMSAVIRPYQRRTFGGGYAAIRVTDPATFGSCPNPAFGGFSSVGDLGRLYVNLMRCRTDGGLLRPETMQELVQHSGGVRFGPRQPSLPFGLGFFLGGSAAGFGDEWDADSFGHAGSNKSHYATVVLCAPAMETVVAVRLSSIGLANNAVLAAVGSAVHSDLHLASRTTRRTVSSG